MNISGIDTLYAYDDGDVITPGMGVSIAAGHVLAQYYDPQTKKVSVDSDFTIEANQPVIYPQAFSSKAGAYIVPVKAGEQWYYNNLGADSAGILDAGGNVKSAYSSIFAKTTYTVNGKTYPALKIKGNLCNAEDLTSKVLYYQSSFEGKQIICKIDIPINVSVGTPYEVAINCVNESGVNDTVIDNDVEFLELTSYLNAANSEISATSYKWQKLTGSEWQDLTTQSGIYTISNSGKSLKVFDAGLNGIETFRAVLSYNGKSFTKTIVLSDTHEPFYIDKGRNISGQSIRKNETVIYTPKVYDRSNGALQNGWNFGFVATDNDGKVISSATNKTTFSIPGTTIYEKGTVNVSITASKE